MNRLTLIAMFLLIYSTVLFLPIPDQQKQISLRESLRKSGEVCVSYGRDNEIHHHWKAQEWHDKLGHTYYFCPDEYTPKEALGEDKGML